MKTNSRFLLAAALGLALTLALSCSSDSNGGNNPSGDGGSTGDTFVDIRDNKPYKFVKIGNQTWMAENLNYDVPSNDTDVCYGDEPANCATYGRLYNWATAGTACPTDWHLPTDAEWGTLMQNANPSCSPDIGSSCNGVATKLKSANWAGTNELKFSALPSGARNNKNGNFEGLGEWTGWWSATASNKNPAEAYLRSMSSSNDNVRGGDNTKEYGISVRCVKD